MSNSFKKVPPTIFSAWFYRARRFWCWKASWSFVTPRGGLPDSFMLSLSLQGVLESLPHTIRVVLQLTPWYCLLLIPPWQNLRRDMWKAGVTLSPAATLAVGLLGWVGSSASCRMVPSFVWSSFSFLMCTTVVLSCSQSCAWACPGKLVMQYWLLSSWLCFSGPSCSVCCSSLCGKVQHLALAHCLMDGFSFVAVNMGLCSRDSAITPPVKVP